MREHMTRAFAVLMSAYPNWNPSSATLALYDDQLADIDPVDLGMAVMMHIRTSTFPPSIAELRKIAAKSDSLEPEEAWLEVARQIKSEGWCGTPKFSSPQVENAVLAVGGWRSLCSTLTSDMGTVRAHFLRCYCAYTRRHDYEEDVKQLAGRSGETLESFDRKELDDMDRDEMRQIDGPRPEPEEE